MLPYGLQGALRTSTKFVGRDSLIVLLQAMIIQIPHQVIFLFTFFLERVRMMSYERQRLALFLLSYDVHAAHECM